VVPAVGKARSLSRTAAASESELAEVRKMRPELERMDRELRQKRSRIQAQAGSKESAAARLSGTLADAGFPQSVMAMKSGGAKDGEFFREESFDLRVENLTYLEAVKLVGKLESGPLPVVIRSAQHKSRYDDSRYVDAALRIGFLTPKGR
jgi:type II secretory pathway component PulJ